MIAPSRVSRHLRPRPLASVRRATAKRKIDFGPCVRDPYNRIRVSAEIEPLEPRRLLATYFVGSTGDDNATGTSVETAWRTVERVNVTRLRAGDTVLFEGGKSFEGNLYVASKEGGIGAIKPLVFSTYGRGRATIFSGDLPGLEVSECAGVAVTNLRFVGSGMTVSDASGIYVHAGQPNLTLSYIHIRNVEATGYGREGVTIVARGQGSSISDVKIDHSSFHDNEWGGVLVTGSANNLNRNYVVDHVQAYNNPGVETESFVTGSGIYLADVEDAIIQRCISYNNGIDGTAPVGIWAAGSNRVTIQYNESFGNRTNSNTDGGGIDLDWDVHNSVVQYNYTHDNDGPGYLLGGGSHVNRNNTLRFNVSENDGRKNGRSGIYLWGNVQEAKIYNNVVYHSATSNPDSSTFRANDAGANGLVPQDISVRNNIFYATGGANLIKLSNTIAAQSRFSFVGNAWYSSGAPVAIRWGATHYTSIDAWRDALGQEKSRGKATGYYGDPRLIDAGNGGTIGDADRLHELLAYRLHKRSPLIDRGRPYPELDADVSLDFFGEPAPTGLRADVGIDEVR